MTKIYQIKDVSDDEIYYTVGHFSTLEKAKELLVVGNVERLKCHSDNLGNAHEDRAIYEVLKITLDETAMYWGICFKIEFERDYEKDEWVEVKDD